MKFKLILLIIISTLSCSSPEVENNESEQFIVTYSLDVSANNGGMVDSASGNYERGTSITLTATPNGEYVFSQWSNGSTENPITITMNSNITLTATFSRKLYPLIVNTSGEGSVSEEIITSGKSTTDYTSGSTIRLTANPATEWVFSGWSGAVSDTSNPIEITVDEAKTVTATFSKKLYPLIVNTSGEGSVSEEIITSGKSTTDYTSGSTIRLTANPATEWVFSGWSGAVSDTSNPIEITVDEAKTVTATFQRNTVNLNLAIIGNGQIRIQRGNHVEFFSTSKTISYTHGSNLNLRAISSDNSHFDGWEGTISDTLQLFKNKTLVLNQESNLAARFIEKNNGNKRIQSDFFDDSVLDYRTSQNFIVWWDKNWDHNHDAKDILRWAEFTREKSLGFGMEEPTGSSQVYINIYLHHIDRGDLDNVDVFDDNWGNGVGTDSNGMPFWTCPKPDSRTDITPFDYNSTLHEIFHVMQHKSGNTYGTFPYSGHTSWYTEAAASWFEKAYLPYSISNGNWYYYFNDFPAITMNPHQSLWSSGIYKAQGGNPWNKTVQMYSLAQFLMYLNKVGAINESFIGSSYYSQTTLTPQEYLYQNITDFKTHFRNFAMKMYSLDWFDNDEKTGYLRMEELYQPGEFLNSYTLDLNGNNSIHPYVLELNSNGTNGKITPTTKPQAWSWSVVKINNSAQATYTIDFDGDLTGNQGTLSDYYVGIVKESENGYNYLNINLSSEEGAKTISFNPSSVNYIVIINTPLKFDGLEEFDYGLTITKE